MTITAETNFIEYTAQGVASEKFVIPFPFFAQTEIFVYMGATEETAALQVLGTNYSVSGGDGEVGSITWNGTPTAGGYVGIFLRTAATQPADYIENDPFPAEDHENALDRGILAEQASLRLSATDARVYDAGPPQQAAGAAEPRRIVNVKNGTGSLDAVNLSQLQAASLTPGSLPTIEAGDISATFPRFLLAVDDSPQVADWSIPLPYMPAPPVGGDASPNPLNVQA